MRTLPQKIKPRSRYRLALLVGSLIVGLLVGELVSRLYLSFRDKSGGFSEFQLPPVRKGQAFSGVGLRYIIQPSRYSNIVYELRPNLDVNYLNGPVHTPIRTNSLGWRGPEFEVNGKSNDVTIVGLGDSHMFGWGVAQDHIYLAQLEKKLKRHYPRTRWRVINTGVPGYNTALEVETLKQKAMRFQPQVVILDYIRNDLRLPDFLYLREDYFSLKKMFLRDLWRLVIQRNKKTLDDVLFRPQKNRNIPQEYQHVAGVESFKQALSKLATLKTEFDFELIVYVTHDHPKGMAEYLTKWGKKNSAYVLYKEQTQALDYWVSETDHHPSPKEHAKKSTFLFKAITKHTKVLGSKLATRAFSL